MDDVTYTWKHALYHSSIHPSVIYNEHKFFFAFLFEKIVDVLMLLIKARALQLDNNEKGFMVRDVFLLVSHVHVLYTLIVH